MQKIEKRSERVSFNLFFFFFFFSETNALIENLTYLARQGGGFAARLTAGMKIQKIRLTAEK